MELKVQRLNPDAKLPQLAHDTDAGYDIAVIDNGTVEVEEIKSDMMNGFVASAMGKKLGIGENAKCWRVKYIEYKTGLAIEPPTGYHLEFVARSSVSKSDLILANCLAIGDNGYRNEYRFRFRILPTDVKMFSAITKEDAIKEVEKYIVNNDVKIFKKGDRAAQLLLRKTEYMPIVEVKDLSNSDRGMAGFGSTG